MSKHQTKKPHVCSDRRLNVNPYHVTDLKRRESYPDRFVLSGILLKQTISANRFSFAFSRKIEGETARALRVRRRFSLTAKDGRGPFTQTAAYLSYVQQTINMSSVAELVRALDRFLEGHGVDSWWELIIFLCSLACNKLNTIHLQITIKGLGDWGGVCWYKCYYSSLPQLTIRLKFSLFLGYTVFF